jgi:hypothetical protein
VRLPARAGALTAPQTCALLGVIDPSTLSRDQEAGVTTGKLRIGLMGALMIAVLALGGGRAAALSFNDISGRWCGSVSSYTFTPSTLVVSLYADDSRHEYPIDAYQYDGDVVTVNWQRDGDKLFTKFSEFDVNERTMVQQPNAAGPRREFRRCGP